MLAFLYVVVSLLLAACTSSAPPVIYGTTQQLKVEGITLTIERLFLSRDPASPAVAQSAPEAAERCSVRCVARKGLRGDPRELLRKGQVIPDLRHYPESHLG
jgi:hypothetical protein